MSNTRKQFVKFGTFILLFTFIIISCGSSSEPEETILADDKPLAVNDVLTVEENSSSGAANQIDVSTNDNLGNDGGDTDNYSLDVDATNGSVTEISDGVFEYIPNSGYFGQDSFSYKISDKDGDTDGGFVTITVNEFMPPASAWDNLDPNLPSFVSIEDTTPDNKKWIKQDVMSDEFDTWNSTKWFKSTWNYGVPVKMSTSSTNSGVTDGKLWIKATLRNNDPEDRWFQTARIHSKTKIKYPMYTEARIKTNNISSYNTYWLNNGDINNRDEIDIIENNSNPSCTNCAADDFPNQMNSQYFQADANKSPQTVRNKGNYLRSNLSANNPLKNKGWNEEYHTYGVWWKDEKNIQFYLDGEPAGSVTVGEHQDGMTYDRIFTRDLEIIFDVWTNSEGWLGGLPPKTDLQNDAINTMRIDWVRTWKLEDK